MPEPPVRITIFGATGGVGQHVVRQALGAGHDVTAFVRTAGRLNASGPRLTVAVGEVSDEAAVCRAVDGCDAVISALGPRTRRDAGIATTATGVLVRTMVETGVRRITVVSAAPLGEPAPGERWVTRRVITPLLWTLLRPQYEDLRRMEGVLMASPVDWTIVRPPRLTNGPRTGRYRTVVGGAPLHGTQISRADLADALLKSVEDPSQICRSVGVAA